jgi:hypothetical protein
VPVLVPYVGWAIRSVGMGIVFPTIPLAVMAEVKKGQEAGELSSTILMDYLGIGIGAGLAGASIALADAGTISIEAGLAGAFAIGIVPRWCWRWSPGGSWTLGRLTETRRASGGPVGLLRLLAQEVVQRGFRSLSALASPRRAVLPEVVRRFEHLFERPHGAFLVGGS